MEKIYKLPKVVRIILLPFLLLYLYLGWLWEEILWKLFTRKAHRR